MTAASRALAGLAVAGLSVLQLVACGPSDPGGEQAQECGPDEATDILQDAGFNPDDLVVVDGCSYSVEGGMREGTTRNAAATVASSEVSSVLEEAHVSTAEAVPARDQDTGPWLLSSERDFLPTPRGQDWQAGQGLVVQDSIDVDGRQRKRYVSWGQERNGDDYLIRVVIDSGSM